MSGFELVPVYVAEPLQNYIWLVRETKSGIVAVVDPGFAAPTRKALEARGWRPEIILLTHHHGDHVGGAVALKEQYGARILAPEADRHRIEGADEWLRDGDGVYFGQARGDVMAVPGHTLGHIAVHFPQATTLFCGDTLFSLGCGRLFEGTPEQMWHSLARLRALPDPTLVCCAHEYTEANGRFALSVEPDNPDLAARMREVRALRAEGRATVSSTMAGERATNPFLRPESAAIRANLGMPSASDVAVFAELRRRKDSFRG